MSASLSARNLCIEFEAADGRLVHALDRVNFEIPAGQFVTLVGPSGSGKSTVIRAFAGLHPPSEGSVHIDGQIVSAPSPRVGLMFQQANLMPWRTVQDNIALPLELAGIKTAQRLAEVEVLLPILGLAEFATAYPGELSGGMAQRAALGRVLIQKPDVLLLDEPFGALDALTREKVSRDLLRIWSEQNQTVLMVTHDINEAIFLGDRVLVMSKRPGRIVEDIPVSLPRPRVMAQIYEQSFVQITKTVREAIDDS